MSAGGNEKGQQSQAENLRFRAKLTPLGINIGRAAAAGAGAAAAGAGAAAAAAGAGAAAAGAGAAAAGVRMGSGLGIQGSGQKGRSRLSKVRLCKSS